MAPQNHHEINIFLSLYTAIPKLWLSIHSGNIDGSCPFGSKITCHVGRKKREREKKRGGGATSLKKSAICSVSNLFYDILIFWKYQLATSVSFSMVMILLLNHSKLQGKLGNLIFLSELF